MSDLRPFVCRPLNGELESRVKVCPSFTARRGCGGHGRGRGRVLTGVRVHCSYEYDQGPMTPHCGGIALSFRICG
jgi:hypothetical protein